MRQTGARNRAADLIQAASDRLRVAGPIAATITGGLDSSAVRHRSVAPRTVEKLADFIEATVDGIVTEAESVGGMDIVRDLAFPLPVAVMGELLGLPRKDHAQLRPLFEAITRGHDMGATEQARQHARFAADRSR